MTEEESRVLRVVRSQKCKKWLHISAIVFGFLSIGGCFVLASLTYILFGDCEDCTPKPDDKEMVKIMRILATVLFLFGILLIALSLCCKGTTNSLAPQVVVSDIPPGDLEKSPAPILAETHTPHRQAFVEEAATNPPDFVAALTINANEIVPRGSSNSSVNEGFWTEELEELDGPVTPPPSYEEALVMRWPNVVVQEHGSQSEDSIHSEDTGL